MSHASRFVKMIAFIFAVTSISFSLSYLALAVWDEPNNAPPACNPAVDAGCNAPINVSGVRQDKAGALSVTTLYDYNDPTNTYFVDPSAPLSATLYGKVGIGTTTVRPDAKFQVTSTSTEPISNPGWAEIRVQTTGSNVAGGADIHFETPDYDSWSVGVDNSSNNFQIEDENVNTFLSIKPNGNVGIGIVDPGEKLDIAGSARISQGSYLKFPHLSQSDANDGKIGAALFGAGMNLVGIKTDATYRKFSLWGEITQQQNNGTNTWAGTNYFSGNVGIGTVAPGAKLEVAGQVKITGGTPGVSKVLTSDASGLASWQSLTGTLPGGISGQTLRHDGVGWVANSFLFNNGAKIGIGTLSMNETLNIKDVSANGPAIDLEGSATNTAHMHFRNATQDFMIGKYDTDNFFIADVTAGGANRLVILKTSGNIGIGTSAPGAKLEVAGQVKITGGTPGAGKVLTSDAAGLASWQALVGGLPGGASGQTLRHDGTAWIANSNLSNNGANVGIGTAAPGYKLDVNGSLNATNYVWKGGVNWSMPDANSEMSFDFATGDGTSYWQVWDPIRGSILAVRNNGNVGIGNSAPSYKLDLNGTLRVSGAGIYNATGSQLVQTNATDWTRWNQGSGATNGNAMYQSLALGTGGLTVGAWENQAAGVLKVVNGAYLATSSGNVGIGTTTPDAKLDISVGGTVQCCAAGQKPNLSLDQASNVNNQMAWLQFHNSGESEAYIRLAGGGAGLRAGARRLEIGDSQGVTTGLTVTGDVTGRAFFYSSDERLKENIQKIEDPLEKILKLNGVTFNWKNGGNESVGLTAQNVEKVFPELVNTDNAGMKSVEYGNLVAPLIEAMKEQQKMIENQQKEIDALKALIK